MQDREPHTFEELMEENYLVRKVISPEMVGWMSQSNEHTVGTFNDLWFYNLRENLKYYAKHGSLLDSFGGFGVDKAVIAVGGGPSFNINKDVLKQIYDYNLQFPLEQQPFIIIATNKQFKPLIEMGIYPHLTLLIDAGDALYPQLCEGIPKYARKSILMAGLHTSPKIIKQWDKQGGEICFYLIGKSKEKKYFEKKTGEDAERIHIQQAGNVMNTLWILCQHFLGTRVFMTVGNDMAFPYSKNADTRRLGFYADKDYKLNIANKHDDAKDELGWMGFYNLHESSVVPGKILYDLKPMGTSRSFWLYKIWMEVQALLVADKYSFKYYNCSESGILGVLAKKQGHQTVMHNRDNWYLMDELIPNRWCTRTLAQAFKEFVEVKLWQKQRSGEIRTGAGYVIAPGSQTDIAKTIVQTERDRLLTGSGIIS